jgi:hypothetical protein
VFQQEAGSGSGFSLITVIGSKTKGEISPKKLQTEPQALYPGEALLESQNFRNSTAVQEFQAIHGLSF